MVVGSKPDGGKTGEKPGLKIIQDPQYRRYGNTVDMDSALETFVPDRSDSYLFKCVTRICKKTPLFLRGHQLLLASLIDVENHYLEFSGL